MGQKVNPHGMRLGIVKTWDAKWYADKDYAENLHEDIKIRDYLMKSLQTAGISRVETERLKNRLRLTIHTAKPGMVIGRGGSGIEQIKAGLKGYTEKRVDIDIAEVKSPDLDAKLVAENVAGQLERRIAFRRAMKSCVGRTMRMGAKGVKIMVSGRLGGAEIARTEAYREGSIPLHTLRADIDYGTAEAATTYGRIGVKVWIFKGEVLPEKKQAARAEGSFDDPASERTYEILQQLTEDERNLLEMRYTLDMDNDEVAAVLGATANAVSHRYRRLLDKCRKISEKIFS